MKKLFSFFCTLCVVLTLIPMRASAVVTSSFDDVSDAKTAAAVETLRVMGVLDGYSDGTFRPDVSLNRAQFCKMVILATGTEKDLGRYSVITVFPDVKPSHWAASYINLAARGQNIIKGYSDGMFHPERTVTLGQAVTILLRLLGYKDEDMGGVWPDGYIAMAESTGLTDGVGSDGSAPLTRGRAAILFANLLLAHTASGDALYSLSDETTLTSFNLDDGKLVTSDKTYDMDSSRTSSGLVGARGRVVLRGGKAITFIQTAAGKTVLSDGAVIVSANGSARGFSALTDSTDYRIFKNGAEASVRDLRVGDVATYSASTNVFSVCDTRLTAYYENCSPSPDAPKTVELLGGTSFDVLSNASDMLSAYKPGQIVTFLLTADGQIAGAVDANPTVSSALRGNAILINASAGTRLICGGSEIPVKRNPPENLGAAVRVTWDDAKNPVFLRMSTAASGKLNLSERKLGSTNFAENVRIYDGDGELLSLNELNDDVISGASVTASRVNWAGNVDLIILDGNPAATVFYGRAEIKLNRVSTEIAVNDEEGRSPDDDDWEPTYETSSESSLALTVDCNGKTLGPYATRYDVQTGDFVAAKLNKRGDGFSTVRKLTKLESVSFTAWLGKTAVSAGGRTYSVPDDVPCYNRDNGRWMTLEKAKEYAKRANLYVEDGAVRIVEVKT